MQIDMISIPAGDFLMGSQPGDPRDRLDEQPQTSIFLSAYSIQRAPVTVKQWAQFQKASGYTWSHWQDALKVSPTENHPIVFVNWYDCVAFAEWLTSFTKESYTLPTEAQWEKACRGGRGQLYPWQENRNNPWDEFGEASKHETHRFPVGFDPSRASIYGCLDMWQNVREWCLDWYNPEGYIDTAKINPVGSQFKDWSWKVFRGGNPAEQLPVAPDPVCHRRGYENPLSQSGIIGFRLAKFG